MEQLPKFVQRNLRSSVNSSHPDPNMLAAFAENALPASERNFLLQHLAQCFDCRELLSLSLPVLQAAPRPVQSPARSWLAWPVLRWAAAGACVVVVGAAVTLHFENHPTTRGAVSGTAQVAAPAVTAAAQQPKTEVDSRTAVNEPRSRPVGARRDSPTASVDKDSRLAKRAAEPVNSPAARQETLLADAAPQRDKTAAMPESSKKESESKALDEASTGQLASPGADASSNEVAELVPGKAKQASQDTMGAKVAVGAAAPAVAAPVSALANFRQALAPRWTLSDGSLQRSVDGGKTWTPSAVGSSANLRALSALGSEIWVGGTNGALYHSSDSGDHWTQVKAEAGGQSLTADIIGVEFTDSQHGKLTTSDQHTWTTSDAGKTWQTR
jgi:hypothetical protein